MKERPAIETTRLVLRPFSLDDASDAERLGYSLVTWDREQLERGSAVTHVLIP